jgi:hypothetical protein
MALPSGYSESQADPPGASLPLVVRDVVSIAARCLPSTMIGLAGGTAIRCAVRRVRRELSGTVKALENRDACFLANHGRSPLDGIWTGLSAAVEVRHWPGSIQGPHHRKPTLLTEAEMAQVLEQMKQMSTEMRSERRVGEGLQEGSLTPRGWTRGIAPSAGSAATGPSRPLRWSRGGWRAADGLAATSLLGARRPGRALGVSL